MNNKDIRWKQRFNNFEKAFKQLSEAHERLNQLDDLAKEGFIQRFEYTLELAWKTLKDYLEDQGFMVKFPREVIKQAFQVELIDDGEIWMKMLKKRNLLAHTYNESLFYEALKDIKNEYYPEIKKLYILLKNE
jgi:nucleotidyltransferase substrate binding protein (TIGR01987 family)